MKTMKGKRLVSLALVAVLLTGITSGVIFPTLSFGSSIKVSSVNIDKEACISYMVHEQNPDGGFSLYTGEKSNLPGTCHALLGLQSVGALDKIDRGACIKWIIQLQNPDGGFSPSLEKSSSLKPTCLAVLSLKTLGALNEMDKDSCLNFISSCQNKDGGFGFKSGEKSNLMATGFTIWALDDMGKIDKIRRDDCIEFISCCQKSNGGFSLGPGMLSIFPNLGASGFAVIGLNRLNGLDRIDKDSCANYIASCQKRDGSFSLTPSPFMNEFASCIMSMMPKFVSVCPMMKKLSMMGMMMPTKGMPPSAFNYSAIAGLKTLNALEKIDMNAFVNFICSCQNPDGGFGGEPGKKSDVRDTAHSLMMLEEIGVL